MLNNPARLLWGFLAVAGISAFASARPALVPAVRELRETGGVFLAGERRLTAADVKFAHDASIAPEGYRLSIAKDGVKVASSDQDGAFYALKTLDQLVVREKGRCSYPCVEINDWPEYRWRGVLLDEGRHFQGKESVKRLLDIMAAHKFNVFHWHLTEDQGWRIDVPGMPELVKYGSVRPDSPAHGSSLKCDSKNFIYASTAMAGEQYGPYFYRDADLREIVAYAAERHITVVPEVDIPGHAMAILAAYPELCCFPENIRKRMAAPDWGIFRDVLCIGNDETVQKLERIFNYLCDVFPSKVIHIGGDECPRVNWKACPKCQARMKAAGLKDENGLQAWITARIVKVLEKRGRRAMGWDEILAGDIPKTAIGQSWRTQPKNGAGTELVSGAAAAERGFDMVMSPHELTYYSYLQGIDNDPFQRTGMKLTLEKAYSFDPATGVSPQARKHVLGGQCCLWGEYIWNRYDLEWRMWPRAGAMAEILWLGDAKPGYADFKERMAAHRLRLLRQGVNSAPLE